MQSLKLQDAASTAAGRDAAHATLRQQIEQAAHLLPSQGPITVFVHHNTLHFLEDLSFDEGVQVGGRLLGCHAYLPEESYRRMLTTGRIRLEDLTSVLQNSAEEHAERRIASLCTRRDLRLAMLEYPLHSGPPVELRWVVAETDALRKFRHDVDPDVRRKVLDETRERVLQRARLGAKEPECDDSLDSALRQFVGHAPKDRDDRTWEAFVLNCLWRVCCDGIQQADAASPSRSSSRDDIPKLPVRRHRDVILEAGGDDPDLLVDEILIRLTSAFLDQGFANWEMPGRDAGLFEAFLHLYRTPLAVPTRWDSELKREAVRLTAKQLSPLESIEESLELLGVSSDEQQEFITQTLLALRGWAGMVRQMETNAEWAPHPAPAGSLIEFLAVRLILDRLAIAEAARKSLGYRGTLDHLRNRYERPRRDGAEDHFVQRAFTLFQLAQLCGWTPGELDNLSGAQWAELVREIDDFPSLDRRRVYHQAYERKYRNETLDAVIAHSKQVSRASDANAAPNSERKPLYQLACCIDEREESFRRHLEEIQPACETFGIAGFFGVAMYYRGVADAHFVPLCPVNVKPSHYVIEQPLYSASETERRRAEARRRLGHATHRAHLGSRSFLGGVLAGLLGSLTAIPLVASILFPRTTAQIRRLFGAIVRTDRTELRLERTASEPGPEDGRVGYTVEEMADVVEGGLRSMGLAHSELLSRLVVICGHGSSSLNNPHEAAHDCGACGGGRGGPNARAFAQMANDTRVRRLMENRGLRIPDETYFVGGYHNTCDDSMIWYDLDRIPVSHRELFEQAQLEIDEARKRSAHERCRRFESARLSWDREETLRHVEGRAEDLSQTRPEYGHATNALCFVGRREWSRGLFLDRRAFLTSYDPAQDDGRCSILERLLQAVIPVCAGINLEYYFSYVDPTGYGCGTKLPHNITSLLGVMDGAASDLRPGLPWQMVEIHEPVRLLFVIETTRESMVRIIRENEAIANLVEGEWVQLAILDPQTSGVELFERGDFVPYSPTKGEIPEVTSSIDWYRGRRDHLGFVSIAASGRPQTSAAGAET